MPDSGLLALLVAVLVAVIASANIPEGVDNVLALESEVTLLSMRESATAADGSAQPDSNKLSNDAPDAYFKIPNFVFNHMAVSQEVADRMDCQRICNETPKCRSYSYREASKEEEENAKDDTPAKDDEEKAEKINDAVKTPPRPKGTCTWSPEGLHYSLGWQFFTKAKDVDWQGNAHLTTENFHKFPGLEYQESGFDVLNNIDLVACKSKCAKDAKCGAFSYNDKMHMCRLAGKGVHYDTQFSYYEKPRDHSVREASQSDIDLKADALWAQEKSAKKAALVNAGKKKELREKKSEAATQTARAARFAHSKTAKVQRLHKAEADLLAARNREKRVEDDMEVQQAFEKGYFEARGAAQEKKTKEVKLKALEIQSSELENERNQAKKQGESRAKKQAADHQAKVLHHETKIQRTKERLRKIKNQELKAALKAQAKGYESLAEDEKAALLAVEKKHEQRIEKLKVKLADSQRLLQKKEKKLEEEKASAITSQESIREEQATIDSKQKAQLVTLKAEYKAKAEEILSTSPDSKDSPA